MVRGPAGWRNAQAARAGVAPSERFESVFYSDADVHGSLVGALGPYDVLNGAAYGDTPPEPVLVLRATVHNDHRHGNAGQPHPGLATDHSAFHGGDIGDEFAALISLALGIRCRSGGTSRIWPIGSDLAGPGVPFAALHRRPYLPAAQRGRAVVQLHEQADTTTCGGRLQHYLELEPAAAVSLVRAARLYERAVWIAGDDPSQAWLWLVGALEVAAEQWRKASGSDSDVLAEVWPELSVVAARHGARHHGEVAAVVSSLIRAQRRFIDFAVAFAPGPPAERPDASTQVDWDAMRDHLRIIYGYRSKALHAGVPFPFPMCEPPMRFPGSHLIEKPIGLSTSAYDGTWVAEDTPMLLWVFERITRHILQSWWDQLPTGP